MKKVNLLGLEIEAEFNEAEAAEYTDEGEPVYITTDGRLIIWNDADNSWMQVRRWAV